MIKTAIGFVVVQKPAWGLLFRYSRALYCISWNLDYFCIFLGDIKNFSYSKF